MNTLPILHIEYKSSSISYYKIGKGERLVLAFHGYGESAKHFEYLYSEAEKHQTTILAIDLPYHGNTIWKEGLDFEWQDLFSITQQIFNKEGIARNASHEVWGYSMGGRIALFYAQHQYQCISRIVLIAPDGIVVNPWYRIATQTYLGNKIFKHTMQHPKWFLNLMLGGYKLGFINKSIYKFASAYVDNEQVRKDLYIRWTCFRNLHPHLSTLKKRIQAHSIPVVGIYGDYDRIIPFSKAKSFWREIQPQSQLHQINEGHKLLQLKYAGYLWKD